MEFQALPIAAVDLADMLSVDAVQLVTRVGLAFVLFVLGYLAAKFVAGVTFRALKGTDVDNRLASAMGVTIKDDDLIERIGSALVFWLLMAAVLVAVLDFVGLSQAAAPVEALLGTVALALPMIGKAILIVAVAWIAGRALGAFTEKVLKETDMDARLARWSSQGEDTPAVVPTNFSHRLGRFVYWLCLFFGLTATMDALGITALVDPLKEVLATALNMLPAFAVAAAILLIGYVGGKLARTIVSNLLASGGLDRLVDRLKLQKVFEKQPASDVAGLLVMAFILIHAVIAALGKLGITTLADPLASMMGRFWAILPAALMSGIIVAIGVVLARFAKEITTSLLEGLGFDTLLSRVGMADLAEKNEHLARPSLLAGRVAGVAVVLIATVQALENIELTTWASYLDTLLGYAVQNVLPAIIIVGIAFALGAFVQDLIASTASDDNAERQWLASIARYAILVFSFTMALHQLNVAQSFVTTSFAILFGALCLAGALAFGLGGREVASDILKRRYEAASRDASAARPADAPPPTPTS